MLDESIEWSLGSERMPAVESDSTDRCLVQPRAACTTDKIDIDSVTSTGFPFTTEYSSKSLHLPIRP